MSDEDTEFPDDLLAGQRDLYAAIAERDAFAASLPWSLEKADAIPKSGPNDFERPAVGDADEEVVATYAKLRARVLELAEFVSCHRHWASFDGPALVKARSALKHHPKAHPALADAPEGETA